MDTSRRCIAMAAFLLSAAGFLPTAAQALSVSVGGVTATQAVLAYQAPSDAACTVQVSEHENLTPLVHDVDPALFAGADADNRDGALTSGGNRVFVVGKRAAQP